jgi:type VI secretion system protein ImpM
MGGHSAGDVASNLIVNALNELILTEELNESIQKVRQCLKKTNEELRDLAEDRFNRQIVGSTVVVMLGNDRQGACLWAGDSRLYRLREGRLTQMTVDHSEADQPDAMAPLAPEKVLKPYNVITRAVGADDDLLLDCETIEIRLGDKFLLCSDGLDKEVAFAEIEAILNANDCPTGAEALLELALNRNARDNVSIVLVEALSGSA